MSNPQLCIYCKKIAGTREHIPAQQFFKGTPDKPLIVVPSCDACNKGFQLDEDFFRQFNASLLMDKSDRAKELMDNEISRSIKRKPALAQQMFTQMKLVNVINKSTGNSNIMTMYNLRDVDRQRIDRVVEKIIKGLFFHEFKIPIPENWIIKIYWITEELENEQKLNEVAKTLKWNIIKEDTFAYGVNFVPKTFQSIWILDFFKVPLFYAFVIHEDISKLIHEGKFMHVVWQENFLVVFF